MATTLKELVVKIGADIGDLEKKMGAATKAVSTLGEKMESAGKKLSLGITLPVVGFAAAAVKMAGDLDSLKRGLIAVTGSASEAERQFARLREVAKLPGLGLEEAVQGSINLQAAGFSAETAERALRAFGNALATVGRGKDDLFGVITALQQIEAKGKVSAEEINQLQERLPGIRKAMQAAFGTADTEALQKMKISTETFITKIIAEFEKLPPVTGGVKNDLENLSDSFKAAANAIAVQLLPALKPLLDGLARMLQNIQRINPDTVKLGIAIAGVAALSGPMLALVGALVRMAAALKAILALKTAATIAGITTGVGLAVLALGALSAVFLKNKLDALAAREAADQYTDSIKEMSRAAAEMELASELGEVQRLMAEIDALKQNERQATAARMLRPAREGDDMRDLAHLSDVQKQISAKKSELDLASARYAAAVRRVADLQDEARKAPDAPPKVPTDPDALAAKVKKGMDAAFDRFADRLGIHLKELGTGLAGVGFEVNRKELGPAGALGIPNFTPIHVAAGPKLDVPTRLDSLRASLAKFGDGAMGQVTHLAAQFGPLAVAAAALKPVFDGLRATLGPALSALARPLEIVGRVLGTIVSPVLEMLQRPLEAVANLFILLLDPLRASIGVITTVLKPGLHILSEIVKGITWVLSYVMQAFGLFVKAVGTVIDKLLPDWLSKAGKGLAKAGDEMIKGARDARAGLASVGKTADDVSRSLQNVPQGFKVGLARFNASLAAGGVASSGAGGGASLPRPGGAAGVAAPITFTGDIIIQEASNGRVVYQQFREELAAKARASGSAAQALYRALPA